MRGAIPSDDLAAEGLPLVRRVVGLLSRTLPAHVSHDDLFGAGMLGLASAIAHFDPRRATRFKAYAECRIRGEVLDELRRLDPLTRDQRAWHKRIRKTRQWLSGALGRAADDEEVARSLQLSLEAYHTLERDLRRQWVSTETLSDELIAPEGQPLPSATIEGRAFLKRLGQAISRLPAAQQLVLRCYYLEERSLQEIGNLMGVTPSRICQIRCAAISALRAGLSEETRGDRQAA